VKEMRPQFSYLRRAFVIVQISRPFVAPRFTLDDIAHQMSGPEKGVGATLINAIEASSSSSPRRRLSF